MTDTVTAEKLVFEVEKTAQVLTRATVFRNRPGNLAFAQFSIPNEKNSTRTLVSVYHGDHVQVRITVIPIDEASWNVHSDDKVCDGDFHNVTSVEFCPHGNPDLASVTFNLRSSGDLPSYVKILNSGLWTFKVG